MRQPQQRPRSASPQHPETVQGSVEEHFVNLLGGSINADERQAFTGMADIPSYLASYETVNKGLPRHRQNIHEGKALIMARRGRLTQLDKSVIMIGMDRMAQAMIEAFREGQKSAKTSSALDAAMSMFKETGLPDDFALTPSRGQAEPTEGGNISLF